MAQAALLTGSSTVPFHAQGMRKAGAIPGQLVAIVRVCAAADVRLEEEGGGDGASEHLGMRMRMHAMTSA